MKVIVLLSSYNGERYIKDQIESILQQTIHCELVVRDDGSSDKTQEILKEYERKGKLTWYTGQNLGPCDSFLNLIKNAGEANYYALSDQDDVWDEDKIEKGLEKISANKYSLYFCKRRIVDINLNELNVQNTYVRSVKPNTALIEGIAYGCTMLFNYNVKKAIEKLNQHYHDYMHDALIYRLVSLCGTVIYDEKPHISYRQHGDNVVGHELTGVKRWIQRFENLSKRKNSSTRSDCAKEIYENYLNIVKPEYRQLIYDVAYVRESKLARTRLVFRDGLITQHKPNVFFLKIFILIGWL